ncbi:uncharacterized protein KQ657_005116 [Scheffersomyces spartinae]|uniref:inorganic diphosphatase n=1 Tax=Scheffersomyces spartinae TaxID=45513 RepID=A0A9P7V9N2_9ASCO|nr:uncharacterized protein KQ657_005116 [Scheffersomyces spartinae]KAG7193917.1 hypothetical protein KQ657_005116 [Scheffersomyces spartinae]
MNTVKQGTKFTQDFKTYAIENDSGKVVSFFHDIPLQFDPATRTANMVVEVPRWSNAKFEISTSQPGNPIVQDVKKGSVRFVKNLFPFKGYIHNYGAFPQTWEDPTTTHGDLSVVGDNDPLDVCEIGLRVLQTGDVKRVKVLGSLAMIDDGELDWKIIAIDIEDELAGQLKDIPDVEKHCPGLLSSTRRWFRDYKLPDGKPPNVFAHDGIFLSLEKTVQIIQQCSNSWKRLIAGEVTSAKSLPATENVSNSGSPKLIQSFDLVANDYKGEGPIPPEIDKSYYYL